LQDSDFQINDNLFRKYINLLFDALIERGLQKVGDNILIKVDYTTDTDDFLILMACVDFGGRSVPLYFSMRSYPKRKGQSDQKKMERAFLRELRHVLSKKYTYTIVADRGFGNDRFAQLCVEFGFDYVLRVRDNLNLTIKDNRFNLKDFLGQNKSFTAQVCAWNREVNFEVKTQNNATWFSSLSLDENFSAIYQKRFGIEKCFQDQKSSGFNIEKTKIRKYDRFKRLYFTMCLAQLFIVILGEYLTNKNHPLKKKFL
jgi:transposase